MTTGTSSTFGITAIEYDEAGMPVRAYLGRRLTAAYESPAQERLRQRYAVARKTWADNPNVREAAATVGVSEREYCDRYLHLYPPLTWTATSTSVGPALDYERAYREAKG